MRLRLEREVSNEVEVRERNNMSDEVEVGERSVAAALPSQAQCPRCQGNSSGRVSGSRVRGGGVSSRRRVCGGQLRVAAATAASRPSLG